ncbi:hypothetical protein AMS68_004794 [Peltaster fructicola]|uniref:Carotenoid oxygenase n=1 Tax=Peltaster fructicola TaxID=286661 RepID=A0A6H0XWY2_9PEZI|nr:hypothetical protein AMS68_004794 [Peltaster fructicola]
MAFTSQKRKRAVSELMQPTPQPKHPYKSGNFAAIHQTLPLTPCTYTGTIPKELGDGEYVRNGSNPLGSGSQEDIGRDYHWFDGDGMLAGVWFERDASGEISPQFVNQYILTDVYLSAIGSRHLKKPILPSIATLVDPLASFFWVTIQIFRTLLLVLLSHLPGSKQKIKKISVANTHIMYHDGRALALCESGPPMRIQLPGLETVGWFNGSVAKGEPLKTITEKEPVLGGDDSLYSFMREWTTAHPKVDPKTKEMLAFHSCFAPPYIQYSILPESSTVEKQKMLNAPVPGIRGARMMHDFGASSAHTIIMDLPLSLDPTEQFKGRPTVNFDATQSSRFGVFPRRRPEDVRWFETDACCIFHTANSWDSLTMGKTTGVNMLACRLTSATLVFAAGNIAPPAERKKVKADIIKKRRMPFFAKYDQSIDVTAWKDSEQLGTPEDEKQAFIRIVPEPIAGSGPGDYDDEQCRLYYYHFDLETEAIAHQWALSAISFEFPSVNPQYEMAAARYVYGCSTTDESFGQALGKATKIDVVVKMDVQTLIARGKKQPPASVTGVVDERLIEEVLEAGSDDPIQAFKMPDGWYAQEPRFVSASNPTSEDDGFLIWFAFDESQLLDNGDVPADNTTQRAKSELWIVNAKDMRTVLARVQLPQRVPYGLHASWFEQSQIQQQRPVAEVRSTAIALSPNPPGLWMEIRDWVEACLG